MTAPLWTPGPWEMRSQPWAHGSKRFFVGRTEIGNRHTLAQVNSINNRPGEAEANATLIASAPELYEAALNLLEWVSANIPPQSGKLLKLSEAMSAALSKAEGKP